MRDMTVASRTIGYIRHIRDGADAATRLAAQSAAIEAECARRGWTLVDVISDVAPGRGLDRPGMVRALNMMDSQYAEILTVTSLDRISRAAADVATILQRATRHGWTLATLDGPVDLTSPEGQMAVVLTTGREWLASSASVRSARRVRPTRHRTAILPE